MTDTNGARIGITIAMKLKRLDLDVTHPVSLEDFVASFRRAGITHLNCFESRGRRTAEEFVEVLEFVAILPNE